MHWLITLLCSITVLFGSVDRTPDIRQKLIVSSTKHQSVAEEDLLKLKIYATENSNIATLQEKYNLTFSIEHFSNYSSVIISPIKNKNVRNELLVVLSPIFPNMFYVNAAKALASVQTKHVAPKSTLHNIFLHKSQAQKKKSFLEGIGLQWLAIWLLAVGGLLLSIGNRRRMKYMTKKQKEMNMTQEEIAQEIKQLGEHDA